MYNKVTNEKYMCHTIWSVTLIECKPNKMYMYTITFFLNVHVLEVVAQIQFTFNTIEK